MKTLIVFLLCTISCCALVAQVPADSSKSVPPNAMDSAGSVNNSMRNDSVPSNSSTNNSTNPNPSSSQNTQTMPGDSTSLNHPANNGRMDSSMNNTNNSANMNTSSSSQVNSTLNNSSNINNNTYNSVANSMNMRGQAGYAALPVLESYVPDAVVSKVKEKYGNTVYDISAVKIVNMQDSGTAMQNSGTVATNTTATTQATSDSSNMVTSGAQSSAPVQYNYIVRVRNGGTLTTEIINTDGTVLNNANAANKQ